jgi:putative hemolysin
MMRDVRKMIVGGLFLVTAVLLPLGIVHAPTMAITDPSASYCVALGYKYVVESTPRGQRGLCQLPNGTAVDSWEFLKGKVGQEYSYCGQKGYEMRTVKDTKTCSKFLTDQCAVCVLEDGREVEVTELMGLEPSCARCYRIPNSTIIAVSVAVVAVALAVILFIRWRMRLAAKGKNEEP